VALMPERWTRETSSRAPTLSSATVWRSTGGDAGIHQGAENMSPLIPEKQSK
jgi:hypothetical protein